MAVRFATAILAALLVGAVLLSIEVMLVLTGTKGIVLAAVLAVLWIPGLWLIASDLRREWRIRRQEREAERLIDSVFNHDHPGRTRLGTRESAADTASRPTTRRNT